MVTRAEIRSALRCGRQRCPCTTERGLVHCPHHAPNLDDKTPNLNVHETRDGKVLVNCKTGCSQTDVLKALTARGLWGADNGADGGARRVPAETRDRPSQVRDHFPRGAPVDLYRYRHQDGVRQFDKGRFEDGESKSFAWRRAGSKQWDGMGGVSVEELSLWCGDDESIEEMLARRPDDEVWHCEGEKATRACLAAGLLACTGGWGSKTRKFGNAYASLRGRRVRVWSDNDAPGAEYGAAVRAELRHVSAEALAVFVEVPHKGDAADYFAAGGTVEGLLEETPDHWILRAAGDASFTAFGPTAETPARFGFTELVSGRSYRGVTLDARLTLRLEPPGLPASKVWTGRANLASLSARTEVSRQLNDYHGKGHDWSRVIAELFSRVEEEWRGLDRSVDQADIPEPGPIRWLLPGLLVDGVANLWFAPGSSMKTILAVGAACALAYGRPFVDHVGPDPMTVLYVDYETNERVWNRRVDRVLAGMGYLAAREHLRYWSPRGETLQSMVSGLRAVVRRYNVGLIIVDSVQWACGGQTDDGVAAMAYFNALAQITAGSGVTTLSLAHVTADVLTEGRIPKKPSGVMTWRDAPRLVLYVRRDEDDALRWLADAPVAWIPVKGNEGARVPETMAMVQFDDSDGFTGPITFRRAAGTVMDYAGIAEAMPPPKRILDLLDHSAIDVWWTVKEVADELELKPDTVSKYLRRNPDKFEVDAGTGRKSSYRRRMQTDMFDEEGTP